MKTTQEPRPSVKNQSEKATNVAYRGYKDGTVEFFGEQILTLTGYHKDDFNGKRIKWVDLICEADRGIAKESFVQALKGDKTYMRDYRIRHREGKLVWFREWGQIICDGEGKVESILGVILDVTEQKRAEEALRRANAYNRSLIEASLDPLVTIDAAGKITDVNTATEMVTGVAVSCIA